LGTENAKAVLPNGLGTTRATVNGVQAITSTLTTEAFGNAVAQWGSSGNPYRFAGAWGYRDDGDAGLLHVGARYYDPQVGRFISRDGVLSEHPYLYCQHEPVNSVDPSGQAVIGPIVVIVVLSGLITIIIVPPRPSPNPPPRYDPPKVRPGIAVPGIDSDQDGNPDYADPTPWPDHGTCTIYKGKFNEEIPY
jgi:RHS repeat-associated protein